MQLLPGSIRKLSGAKITFKVTFETQYLLYSSFKHPCDYWGDVKTGMSALGSGLMLAFFHALDH